MRKILLTLFLVLFLMVSCSTETTEELKSEKILEGQISGEGLSESACKQIPIEYEIFSVESELNPVPSEVNHKYDVGTVRLGILNKDDKIDGYFNISVSYQVVAGKNTESQLVNLASGERKDIQFTFKQNYPPGIYKIYDPVVVSRSKEDVCE
jgi:hypothetical protein|tara:strand:- start:231 stop:689 length:459 start_codon:yes stop_codon:yes gene_type:complete